jgi:hypothetical protein
MLCDPCLNQVVAFLQTLSNTNDLAAVFEHIPQLVAELPESILRLAIAVEEIRVVAILRMWILEVVNHDIHKS